MVVTILLYGCTTWTLNKCVEKEKLDGNYKRKLRAVLNKSWSQHPTKQQLQDRLWLSKKFIKLRGTRHVEHYWGIMDELICDILQWTPTHWRTTAERPARINIQQLCADTGCSLEDMLGAIDDRDGQREGESDPCLQRDMILLTS